MDVKAIPNFNNLVITYPLGDVRRTRTKSTGRPPSHHFIKEILQKVSFEDDSESISSDDIENHTEELEQSLLKSTQNKMTAMENIPEWKKRISQKKVTITEPNSISVTKSDAPWLIELRNRQDRKLSFRENEKTNFVEPKKEEKNEIKKVVETTNSLSFGKTVKQQLVHSENITKINAVETATLTHKHTSVPEVNKVLKVAISRNEEKTKENKEIKYEKQCDDQVCVDSEDKEENKQVNNDKEIKNKEYKKVSNTFQVKSKTSVKTENSLKSEKQKSSDSEIRENSNIKIESVATDSNEHYRKTKKEMTKQVDTDVKEKLGTFKLKAPLLPADEFNIKSNGELRMVSNNSTKDSEKSNIKTELQNNQQLDQTSKNFKEPSVDIQQGTSIEQIIHNIKNFEKKSNERMNKIKKDLDNIKCEINLYYEDTKSFIKLVEKDLLVMQDKK